MQHFNGLQEVNVQDAWLTIGSFDGVHLGHQQIIQRVTAGAHTMGAPAVVLTFHPHPSVVLRGPRESFYLTTQEEKAALLGGYGVDMVITYPFNRQVASIKARDFIDLLHDHLNIHRLLVGHDFALGHHREGNVVALREFGEELGFTVQAIEAFRIGGEVVSSSRIRRSLEAGRVDQAAELLGRLYALRGVVEHGDGSMGMPTANLSIPKEQAVPGAGVYAVHAVLGGKTYQAVSNVGIRPTFETEVVAPRVEAHILDFDEEIYGEEIELIFLAHLRGEQRFPHADALVAQIHMDIAYAREIFTRQEMKS
jgi:riboflavin kinase/FMN adenylyltransferase